MLLGSELTVASAASFYGPSVTFHGKTRTISSVLAEKRRFAERWPDRTYRHRPETAQVTCELDGERCTVRSSFDFDASNSRQGKRALGIGEHELVVSFSSGRPVIEAENSRVVRRGHGNLTWLLRAGVEFAAPVDQVDPRTSTGSVRAAPETSRSELEASSDAVEKCGDSLTTQARRLRS
jgi:hypothetical protein